MKKDVKKTFSINRSRMDIESKTANSKTTPSELNVTVFDSFKLCLSNFYDELRKLKVYNMAHWVNYIDRWIRNLNSENIISYSRGAIVSVDLGAQNFKYEPSYTHPCIILVNRYNTLLVVPCSSKKYGTGFHEIIDATPLDGFSCNTGVQVESFRWIHKNRVVSTVGKASNGLLNKIDDHFLKLVPKYKMLIKDRSESEKMLTNKIAELEKENTSLKAEIGELNK